MKKLTFALTFIVLLSLPAHAQLVLTDADGQDITNEELTIQGTSNADIKVHLYFANESDRDVEVFVRKIEVDMVEGSANTFCWDDFCYSPTYFEAEDPITLSPGEVSGDDDFYTEFFPQNQYGLSTVVYEFFDDGESFETVLVTFHFDIDEVTTVPAITDSQTSLFDAYPNPARDHTWLNYALPGNTQNAEVVVRNLLGNVVLTQSLEGQKDRVKIDTGHLRNGIYIYSLVINNQVADSKRLVIAN